MNPPTPFLVQLPKGLFYEEFLIKVLKELYWKKLNVVEVLILLMGINYFDRNLACLFNMQGENLKSCQGVEVPGMIGRLH